LFSVVAFKTLKYQVTSICCMAAVLSSRNLRNKYASKYCFVQNAAKAEHHRANEPNQQSYALCAELASNSMLTQGGPKKSKPLYRVIIKSYWKPLVEARFFYLSPD